MSYVDCPYYDHGGVCDRGCWEEPICRVNEPRSGWNLRDPEAERVCPVCAARLDLNLATEIACATGDGCGAVWDRTGRLVRDPDPAFG